MAAAASWSMVATPTRSSGRRVRLALLVLSMAVLLAPVSGAAGVDGGSKFPPLAQDTEQTFLGFRQGQEVRYALEGEGDRRQDRTIHWSITLREVGERGSEGTFDLSYVAVVGGQSLAQAIAQVRINAYGFPLNVHFTSERNTPLGAIGYSIEYRFEDERFRKELVGESRGGQKLDLEDYPDVNTSFPRGLYLFNPLAADCTWAFSTPRLVEEETTGGGRGEPRIEEYCSGRELIFTNPGLLSLTMPALWEAGTGVLDFFVLAPTGMRLELLTGPSPGASGGGFTVGGLPLGALLGGGPKLFDDAEDALQRFGLAAGSDLLQLDLGGRMVDAWRLDPPAPFAAVYVDGNGLIVRMDLPADPADPSSGGRAWIRRLRPSEF